MRKITRILHHYKSIPASWPPLLLNNKIALTIFIAVILYFVFYHDIFRNYLSSPDADIIYAYEALLLNESWRQDLHTHRTCWYLRDKKLPPGAAEAAPPDDDAVAAGAA